MYRKLLHVTQCSLLLFVATIPVIFFLFGCSTERKEKGTLVATVNKEPVKLEDFQREMALRSKQNPSYAVTPETVDEQLSTIIDRRLMIQEAMKMGLAGKDEFVRTIQTFWEQTLIRELIDAKYEEWEDRFFVTEQEIQDYYKNLTSRILIKTVRTRNRSEADMLLEKARRGEELDSETIGPITYSEVDSTALKNAFALPEGESAVYEDGQGFLVVYMERKDIVDMPPIANLYTQLKDEILEQKKTRALEAWLAGVREKSVIEIHEEVIHSFFEGAVQAGDDGHSEQGRGGDGR